MRDLISRFARRFVRLLVRDERGAVGVVVASLLGAGVATGMGAMVIDVGQLYVERAQLQSGADAAALAVAKSCATGTCAPSIAAQYANENSKDGSANVSQVCVSGTLGTCPAATGALTDCPAAPPSGNYVDVHVSTQTSSGGTVIPPVFGSTLLGNGNYAGTTVYACSQAEWTSGGSGGVNPNVLSTEFTIPACQWDKATSNGTVFAPAPPTTPATSYDQVLRLSYGNKSGCSTEPSGSDGTGTFGWVLETGGCTLQITGTTYSVHTSTTSANCNTPLYDDAQDKSVIYVPVYTSVSGSGSTAVFNLKGISTFVVTGYNIPGSTFTRYTDWLKSSNQCTGTTYCINGYFTGSVGSGLAAAYSVKLSG